MKLLKSMVLPLIKLHRYDPKQAGKLREVIALGRNWKHELDTFLSNYRNTPHCATGQTTSFLLFSRDVRDKLSTALVKDTIIQ